MLSVSATWRAGKGVSEALWGRSEVGREGECCDWMYNRVEKRCWLGRVLWGGLRCGGVLEVKKD